MAIPKVLGDNPVVETIPKDVWSLVQENVTNSKIHNNFGANVDVWFNYVKTGDPAPTENLFSVGCDGVDFEDQTPRDLYLYPVGEDVKVLLEQ